MKKLLSIVALLSLAIALSFGQNAPVTGSQPTPAKKDKTENAETKPADDGKKLKKDGTPDKRYKENKTAPEPEPTGPKKKDGTPDKRYKENKDKPAKPQ